MHVFYAVKIRRKGILMIFLLALPVFAAAALAHRYLQMYAPTNRLVRRVRTAAPRFRTAAGLLAAAAVLLIAMHVVAEAVAAGAPGWLNLVVLVLGWDSVKLGWLVVLVLFRWITRGIARWAGRGVAQPGHAESPVVDTMAASRRSWGLRQSMVRPLDLDDCREGALESAAAGLTAFHAWSGTRHAETAVVGVRPRLTECQRCNSGQEVAA
jgi:hypothetical protein